VVKWLGIANKTLTSTPASGAPEPTKELMNEWWTDNTPGEMRWSMRMAKKGAAWGADEQLKRCAEWMRDQMGLDGRAWASLMLGDLRPQPPSPKQQALEELKMIQDKLHAKTGSGFATPALDRILESLPD
jgi:hypothetical protein